MFISERGHPERAGQYEAQGFGPCRVGLPGRYYHKQRTPLDYAQVTTLRLCLAWPNAAACYKSPEITHTYTILPSSNMARLLHTSWQRLGLLCLSLSLLLVPYLFTLVSASSANYVSQSRLGHVTDVLKTHLFTRAANNPPLLAVGGSGNEYVLGDGTHIFDASGGAAVSCIGRYHKRVADAWVKQYQKGIGYLPASLYAQVCSDLATFLVDSTGGKMVHAEFYGSGESLQLSS